MLKKTLKIFALKEYTECPNALKSPNPFIVILGIVNSDIDKNNNSNNNESIANIRHIGRAFLNNFIVVYRKVESKTATTSSEKNNNKRYLSTGIKLSLRCEPMIVHHYRGIRTPL